jgi:glycerol kinase
MSGSPHYLALDQGSHASKALIFDAHARLVASGEVPIATRQPRSGWVEHDPEALVASVHEAIAAALAASSPGDVRLCAAGLAIQRSSVVCWDRETGEALSPVLSWQDRRNAKWLRAQGFDAARLRRITGLVDSPHYGASKLRWCLDHLPEVQRALARERLCCGPLASFVLHRLLEERPCLADPANASRTLLWDVRARDWSDEMLADCGIPRDCLPACVPSRHRFGTLRVAGRDVPLEVATGDQPAALFAWGEPDPGTLYVNIGTGAFVQQIFPGAPPDAPGLLQGVAWQEAAHSVGVLEGTVNGAGAALEWLARERGAPLEALRDAAERWLLEIEDPPLFVNGVGGLGAPYWVADCPIRFSRQGSLAEQTVAVLESIVFLLQVNIEAMRAAPGAQPAGTRRIIASGGLARYDGVCQRLADLAGLPVERPADVEATARGLAWLLSGAVDGADPAAARFVPQPAAALLARFANWRAMLASSLPGVVAGSHDA